MLSVFIFLGEYIAAFCLSLYEHNDAGILSLDNHCKGCFAINIIV